MMYQGINRLWVSCVSKRGYLSDSVFNVFANPECICTNEKTFDYERESTQTLSTTPLELRIHCSCVRTHAGVFDFTIFSPTIIWNSFSYGISNSLSPCYLEMWMTHPALYHLSYFPMFSTTRLVKFLVCPTYNKWFWFRFLWSGGVILTW